MLLYKKIIYLALSLTLFCIPIHLASQITQISSIEAIQSSVCNQNEDTLVVFDIDEVLFTDADAILRPVGDSLRFQIFNEHYLRASSKKERDDIAYLHSIPLLEAKKCLIEESTPKLIQFMQSKGIKVIALTSCPTEPIGVVHNMEKWRLSHLKSFNYNFSKAFEQHKRFVFNQIKLQKSLSPVYNQGVIFTNHMAKADVLVEFLKIVNFCPKKVIFIDDRYHHLKLMEAKLSAKNIPFEGYYYVKVEKEFSNDLCEKRARFQLEHLLQEKSWISDDQATEELKKQ